MASLKGVVAMACVSRRLRQIVARIAASLAFFGAAAVTCAVAAESGLEALSDADKTCLQCHGQAGLKKDLANGEALALHVEGEAFARSVHKAIGCAGCHGDVDLAKHPGATAEIRSVRQYAIERAAACRACHEDSSKHHEGSVHAARVREGNALAPVCTGCHGSHAVTPKTAYETCVGCHAAALDAHQKWLPNARLHHEVVSCAACHAPTVLRMIDLRLYDGAAKRWVSEKEGEAKFEKLARSIDANGDGLDPRELRDLVREVNRDAGASPRTFRGRVELRTGVETHRLSGKATALKACDNCHRDGAEPFQNITVSITGPDGRPLRYRAHKEVLTSVLSVESLREFYAIGGTRSKVLDILFVLTLLGGIGVPLGHMTIRWLSRRQRNR
jgi:hypothetical protein